MKTICHIHNNYDCGAYKLVGERSVILPTKLPLGVQGMAISTLRSQQGMVLPLTLIFLLVLTLLGITAMKSGVMGQKISGNTQDKHRSFEAAEMGLKNAETWLYAMTSIPVPTATCTTTPCILTTDPLRYPESQVGSWWQLNAGISNVSQSDIYSLPTYALEFNRFVPDDATIGLGYTNQGTYFYRITAQGTGYSSATKTFLQTNAGRRY